MSPSAQVALPVTRESKPPIFCPYCGCQSVTQPLVVWAAYSTDDLANTAELDEHQCEGACEGRSFWA